MHIVLRYLKPYALCNTIDFDDLTMIALRYEIEPFESIKLGENTKKHVQITEIGMGSYKIEGVDLFTSIKDLGKPKILSIKEHQWCEILPEGHQWCGNDEDEESSFSITSVTPTQTPLTQAPSSSEAGKLFPSPFVHKYMVQNCKYKGGGLGRNE